jgi:peptidoglycan/LPS O-acetylase OafA/YrhL
MKASTGTKHYLPGLDGLRAMAIVLVVIAHAQATARTHPTWWWHLGDIGNMGVRIFFVISGFLITYLLLQEERKHGCISLRGFYARRVFRILPAMWVFLAAMLILRAWSLVVFPTLTWIQGLTFTVNYLIVPRDQWVIGHLWSLSVEEQFYLAWPTILVIAPRRFRIHIVSAAILVSPLLRLTLLALGRAPHGGFFTTMDALAVGCLIALLRDGAKLPSIYLAATRSKWIIVLPAIMIWVSSHDGHPWIYLGLILPILNLSAGVMVETASRGAFHGWQRVLDQRNVRWLGRLSYSLYLWQQVFLNSSSRLAIAVFPVNIVLACAAAVLSYYLVEQPALRWGARVRAGGERHDAASARDGAVGP